jgi:hypothetical protein
MTDEQMDLVPYPDPVPDALLDKVIQAQIDLGWGYDTLTDEAKAKVRMRRRIGMRLRLWLRGGLGLDPGRGLHPLHPRYQGPQNPDPRLPG